MVMCVFIERWYYIKTPATLQGCGKSYSPSITTMSVLGRLSSLGKLPTTSPPSSWARVSASGAASGCSEKTIVLEYSWFAALPMPSTRNDLFLVMMSEVFLASPATAVPLRISTLAVTASVSVGVGAVAVREIELLVVVNSAELTSSSLVGL